MKNSRLVVLVADLQSIHMGSGTGVIRRWIFKFISFVEFLTFKLSDHAIFMSDSMLQQVGGEKLFERGRVDVCYPGVTLDNSKAAASDVLSFIQKSKINIVYSGALGEKQTPRFLYSIFDAASKLSTETEFFILSEGDLFEEIKAQGEADGSKVRFFPLVDEENVTELYAKSFIQVVPQKPFTSDGSLPSKVPNLMSNRVAIFSITDHGGDLACLLDQYSLGRHTQSGDPVEVANQLLDFSNELRTHLIPIPESEQAEIDAILDSKFSFTKFIDILVK
jgi:hypothetical protein